MTSELEEQFDVVCVGGGLGGLAAALSAQAHGLSALVLEKSSYVGGGAAYSGGLCWVASPWRWCRAIPTSTTPRRPAPPRRDACSSALSTAARSGRGALVSCRARTTGSGCGTARCSSRPGRASRPILSCARQRADVLTVGAGLAAAFVRAALAEGAASCLTEQRVTRLVTQAFGRGSLPFVRRRYGDPSHQPNANLGPVAEPPFYGLPLRLPGTGMCTFGLRTDEDGRVLRRDGSPVPGLHAPGNAVATTEFRGYVTGYANSRNLARAHRSVCAMSASPVPAPAPRRSSCAARSL